MLNISCLYSLTLKQVCKPVSINSFPSPCAAQVPDDEQFVPDFQSDNCEYLLNIHVARKWVFLQNGI